MEGSTLCTDWGQGEGQHPGTSTLAGIEVNLGPRVQGKGVQHGFICSTASCFSRMLCPEKADLLGLESVQKTKQGKLSVGSYRGAIVVFLVLNMLKGWPGLPASNTHLSL